jgi:hypothetical protein
MLIFMPYYASFMHMLMQTVVLQHALNADAHAE